MGKHEPIKPKPSSTARVAKHRAAMKAKGYRLKQVWVRDTSDPAFRERLREESRIIADMDRQSGDGAWCDAFAATAWADLPD
jgi:Protein  of unknown function (DUF3018)